MSKCIHLYWITLDNHNNFLYTCIQCGRQRKAYLRRKRKWLRRQLLTRANQKKTERIQKRTERIANTPARVGRARDRVKLFRNWLNKKKWLNKNMKGYSIITKFHQRSNDRFQSLYFGMYNGKTIIIVSIPDSITVIVCSDVRTIIAGDSAMCHFLPVGVEYYREFKNAYQESNLRSEEISNIINVKIAENQ